MDRDQEVVEAEIQTKEEPEVERVDKEIEMELVGEGEKGESRGGVVNRKYLYLFLLV
jgi:hypothetical protein